ncbi:MAG: tetratricopeptide repeat protein [Flavobacterium sp.]
MKRFLPLALLLPLIAIAQKSYDFKEAELRTRKLVYTAPDSALAVIKRTLSQKGKLHDTIYGNTYNLYGMYYGMKGNPDSSIYYFRKSLSFVDAFPRNKVRSLLNLSIAYRNKGEHPTAIKLAQEVVDINTKIANEIGVGMAYGEIASSYNLMNDYDKSIDYLLKAINILKKQKGNKQLAAVKQKLANTYLRQENFDFALDIYKECLVDFKAMGADKNYHLTLLNMGEAYIHTNRLSQARSVLTEAALGLEKYGDKEIMGITYSKIGNLERQLKNNAKAIAGYDNAFNYLLESKSQHLVRIGSEYIDLLNFSNNFTLAKEIIAKVDASKKLQNTNDADKLVYQKAVAVTYAHTNDDKKAIEAFKNTVVMMDSLAIKEKKEDVKEIQAKFQTEEQREKNIALAANNETLQKAIENEKRVRILYIGGSVAVIILILSILRQLQLKNKLQNQELKSIAAEKNLIEQQHRHDTELNNAQKEIIEEKQRELTSLALQMANQQDSLNVLIERCGQGELTKVNDVKRELLTLTRQKDYWKQFETRFNNLHPDFNASLSNRFSKLTKNDIEFCSLLKLNLSNKEIASLLQISHESAITKKYRIKKKMEIADDAEFDRLLMEI